MDIGWNFRREHLRLQQRLATYVIPKRRRSAERGPPPNASVWYLTFRENQLRRDQEALGPSANNMAKAATMMTDTELHHELLGSAWPAPHEQDPWPRRCTANIEKVGLPNVDREADQALAKAVQREMKVPENRPGHENQPDARPRGHFPTRRSAGGGSDDIGDISWNVPTVTIS